MSIKAKNVAAALFLTITLANAVFLPVIPQARAQAAVPASASLVGKTAPAFTLKDSNGKSVSLSDYKGKFVVLEWINFDCPFVQKHYGSGNMQSLQKKYTDKGVVWISINSSAPGRQGNYPPAKINQLIKEHKSHQSEYLLDDDGKVGNLYSATSTPSMYVIDTNGKLLYAGAIDDKNSTDETDIKSAKNYVAAALDAALAGKPVAVASTQSYGCSIKYKE